MKKLLPMFSALTIGLFAMTFHASASAERWIAQCTNGQNLHYVQDVNGIGHIYMQISLPNGEKRLFPFASTRQSRINNVSICGQVLGNRDPSGKRLAQICANQSQRIIYMKFTPPYGNEPIQEGVFCEADVWVQP